jgi:hypothetical protein
MRLLIVFAVFFFGTLLAAGLVELGEQAITAPAMARQSASSAQTAELSEGQRPWADKLAKATLSGR